jgi:hypothetical protein
VGGLLLDLVSRFFSQMGYLSVKKWEFGCRTGGFLWGLVSHFFV